MEGFEKREAVSESERIVRNFIENLKESIDTPTQVSRESLNQLIEQGVSIEDLCNEFVKQGFVLHGTGISGLEKLEPRQANDEGGYEENLQNAVYATDDPRIPIFMALRWGLSGTSQYSIFSSRQEDGQYTETAHFSAASDIPSDTVGSVYVLPKDTFEVAGSDSQLVSLVSVTPRFELPVTLSDFPYTIEKIEK
jgi:hypothetical protein